jgi:hypothetical protein
MDFLNNIKEFFSIASQNNFDLASTYEQTPQGVYSVLAVIFVICIIAFYFIRKNVKINSAVKLSNNIVKEKSFESFDKNLEQLIKELPKRGEKLAVSLNENKELILSQELDLIKDFDISKKIECYVGISNKFKRLDSDSKKFNINELNTFFNEKSNSLLNENLLNEIKTYINSVSFNNDEVTHVKSILAYANKSSQKIEILELLKKEISRFSFFYNIQVNIFAKQITKDDSKEIFDFLDSKLKDMFKNEQSKISAKVLNYYMQNDDKALVYSYLKSLKDATHLQQLYFELFGKADDIDLDLAFVANETKINEDYKNYLDNKFTFNWSDLKLVHHILNAPRVLETIGHIHYRNVLERIEKLENQKDNNKAISEALEIARRAEFIANEAKQIANKSK